MQYRNCCHHEPPCDCNVLDVIGITVTTGSQFALNMNPKALKNGKCYTLRICQCLPVIGENGLEPVTIIINGQTIPLYDKIGNILLAGQLRGKRRYRVAFGDNVPHFLTLDTCDKLEYNPNPAYQDI